MKFHRAHSDLLFSKIRNNSLEINMFLRLEYIRVLSDVLTMLVLFSNHTEFVQIARVDLQGYELPCGIMAELSCANG